MEPPDDFDKLFHKYHANTHTPLLVGFVANRGVGKSTTARELCELLESNSIPSMVCPMATPVKDVCRSLGWDGKKDDRGRNLLVTIGNGAREYDSYIWVNRHVKSYNGCDEKVVIIDDIRYQNEIDYVRNNGGIIVHLIGGTPVECPSENEWRAWVKSNIPDITHNSFALTYDKTEWSKFVRMVYSTISDRLN